MNEMETKYYEELSLVLKKSDFQVGPIDDKGLLSVKWQGQPLCTVTAEGGVRYLPDDDQRAAGENAVRQVTDIAKATAQYMKLLEAAPPLKAKGLGGNYRLLAEFNGTVLAGQPTKYGVQFVTWERDFVKTGLCWGHYFEDYEKAKRDFATRSGLVAERRQFSAEQLTEVYRTVHETLESGYYIPEERERLLKGVVEHIEQAVPDLQERVSLSNQKELEAGMLHGQTM